MTYIASEEEARPILERIRAEGLPVGLDTEFYGLDIREQSPVARSVCHVFSLAIPDGPIHPRGHHECTSWVLDGSLLRVDCVRAVLEDPEIHKPVHNQPVDHHTIRNAGVRLRGAVNTLQMARFILPSRVKGRGFDLDSLGEDLVGVGKSTSYKELLGYEAVEEFTEDVMRAVCVCGATGCRKRKGDHWAVDEVMVSVTRKRKVQKLIPLTDLHQKHPLWERYVAYAARDAVLAVQIYEHLLRLGQQERPYPWPSLL